MASSTLAIPPSYHQSTSTIKKNKLDTKKVCSEDELLKFFLHGSYDVQRGNPPPPPPPKPSEETTDIIKHSDDAIVTVSEEEKVKSRFMFEETYMINISVKQPDAKPSSKQIDVRIEKAASDGLSPKEKVVDDDEISSIFDEEEDDDDDEVESVIFNEIDSTSSDTPVTKLTLADMINKTLTTIPAISMDNLNTIGRTNSWYVEQQKTMKTRKTSEEIPPSKRTEKMLKTSSPVAATIQQPILTTNIKEDEKLFEYLDYLETKDGSNQRAKNPSPISKTPKVQSKIPSKSSPQEAIPIIDLEQLCRSLTVNDLKDELIRQKIYELQLLLDEHHKQTKRQVPLVKPRKDSLPILIAMPPVVQQRRRTAATQPVLHQSKAGNFPSVYNADYPPKQYPSRQVPLTHSIRKYQYT